MTLPKRAVIIIASVVVLFGAGASIGFAQTDEQLADYSRSGPYLGIFFVYGKEAFDVSDVESQIETQLEAARMAAFNPVANPQHECDPAQGFPCQTSTLVDRSDG